MNFHRGRLPRTPRSSVWLVFLAILLTLVMLGGNIALDPRTIGFFAAYFAVLFAVLCLFANPVTPLQWVYWMLDQIPVLHRSGGIATRVGRRIATTIMRLRRKSVAFLVKTDEVRAHLRICSALIKRGPVEQIHTLLEMMLYVQDNEPTSCVKIVHFYESSIESIPSELEANMHIIDEAFPHITVDLVGFPLLHYWILLLTGFAALCAGTIHARGYRGAEPQDPHPEEHDVHDFVLGVLPVPAGRDENQNH